jgi:molybdenum-dependent DNA-binding transcriptional regulator ModE
MISENKRQYISVSLKQKINLVKEVEEEGRSIKESSSALGINYSTAKHIINVFRKTGDV